MKKDKSYLYLCMMTFARYFGDCLFYAYFILFLESRGLTEGDSGAIYAILPLAQLVVNPIWNIVAKNANSNRKIMRVITIIEGMAIILFTGFNLPVIFIILTIIVGTFGGPFYTLLDGFVETYCKAYGSNYGKIRSCGTIGYFFASLFAALLLFLFNDNYSILLILSGIIFILTSLWFFIVKPIDLTLVSDDGVKNERNFNKVLSNKHFWIFVIMYVFVFGAGYVADQFVGSFFTVNHNISGSSWSIIFCVMLIIEFVVMQLSSRLKLRANYGILIGGIFYFLRSFILVFDLPLPFLIIGSILRGFAYGIFIPSNMKAVEKICGIENVTTAFMIISIFNLIFQTLNYFILGNIITSLGYQTFFLIVSLSSAFGYLVNVLYQIKIKFNYDNIKIKG